MDQLHHVALQIQNVIICLEARSVRRILQCKRPSGFIIDEIKDCCQGIIRPDRFAGHFAVQGQILMRDSLCSGDVHPLRGDGFIFSRSVCLDRLALAAGHDLAGAGWLRWNDDSAIFRVDGRDRRVRMDRACFRPRSCVTGPFWDRRIVARLQDITVRNRHGLERLPIGLECDRIMRGDRRIDCIDRYIAVNRSSILLPCAIAANLGRNLRIICVL